MEPKKKLILSISKVTNTSWLMHFYLKKIKDENGFLNLVETLDTSRQFLTDESKFWTIHVV